MSGASQVLCGLHALEAYLDAVAAQGETLALVPTMGALHDGHLSLVEYARQQADRVMMSIFVNPTQFGPGEDFLTYPREPHSDQKAFEAGCHVIFMPDVETMYPQGSATTVVPGPLAHTLCGASRPGHFEGVCTVVLKLLNLTGCQHAIFGRKDFQQLAVIRSMVRDLNVPTTIHGCPIVRESDGLAMSSRNARLTPGPATRLAHSGAVSVLRSNTGWQANAIRDSLRQRSVRI